MMAVDSISANVLFNQSYHDCDVLSPLNNNNQWRKLACYLPLGSGEQGYTSAECDMIAVRNTFSPVMGLMAIWLGESTATTDALYEALSRTGRDDLISELKLREKQRTKNPTSSFNKHIDFLPKDLYQDTLIQDTFIYENPNKHIIQ